MILICFGTRPEFIKLKSIIDNFKDYNLKIKTCFTGQHKDLLKDIVVDYILEFENGYSMNRLNDIFINILKNTHIFDSVSHVMVQGDTTTGLAMAISAFHMKKKIIHLESGLRTNNINDPFPEEMNRQLISRISDIHLCPTENNKQNLLNENINKNKIYVVGNTGLDNIKKNNLNYENIILITLHRRNNLDSIDHWFLEINKIAKENTDIEFILPIHPNPDIQKFRYLLTNVNVIDPINHDDIITLIKKCKFIISDSGGIQEEASFLNKKIIICREDTERNEILNTHGIICENPLNLKKIFYSLLNNYKVDEYCPFGDGYSYRKILPILNNLG
tara:strand:- start:1123 stop:2121 length:999 start_codon:yes stop_codon:yes gene_type:complete